MKTKKLAAAAVLTALAMILSYIEAMIPAFIALPGVKIGFANIASVFALYIIGWRGAACISILRVSLSALLFGTPLSFFYSFMGAVLSLLGMMAIKALPCFSSIAVSTVGGVLHNLGQIMASAIVMKTAAVFTYMPVLLVSGTVAGVVVGVAAGILVRRLEKTLK